MKPVLAASGLMLLSVLSFLGSLVVVAAYVGDGGKRC